MRKLTVVSFQLLVLFLLFTITCTLFDVPLALAHLRGQPIAKINGLDTKAHPVQAVQPFVFNLPTDSDIAPENYLVNTPLQFVLDLNQLPSPPEVMEKTELIWDFGDGSPTQSILTGDKNSHTYNKTGTFVMQVSADYAKAGFENLGIQPIQTIVINILPDKNYQLPKPQIKINGSPSPASKSFDLDLNKRVTFDASSSTYDPSSKLVSYQWNFDDGKESNEAVATNKYKLPQYYATPVLQIKDDKGFVSEEYVTLTNIGKNEPGFF